MKLRKNFQREEEGVIEKEPGKEGAYSSFPAPSSVPKNSQFLPWLLTSSFLSKSCYENGKEIEVQ